MRGFAFVTLILIGGIGKVSKHAAFLLNMDALSSKNYAS